MLAGDYKQLDAIIKSKNAKNLGFKISWMQNLLENKPCYMRHYKTKQLNPHFVTVLNNNYRSHPEILEIPSRKFYGGQLKAMGKIGMFSLFMIIFK